MLRVISTINIRMEREATSTSNFTAKTESWRAGDLVQIDTISVCNLDSNNKEADVGVIIGNVATYIETLDLATDARWYMSTPRILIPSDSKVVVRFINPDVGDKYYINIFGRILAKD